MVLKQSSTNTKTDIKYIVRKGINEAVKYTTKLSNLEKIIDHKKFQEYSEAIHKVHIIGTSGEFRGLLKEVKDAIKDFKKKELKEAQEVRGEKNWTNQCPNCGSKDIEHCEICYVRLLSEIQRVKAKISEKRLH